MRVAISAAFASYRARQSPVLGGTCHTQGVHVIWGMVWKPLWCTQTGKLLDECKGSSQWHTRQTDCKHQPINRRAKDRIKTPSVDDRPTPVLPGRPDIQSRVPTLPRLRHWRLIVNRRVTRQRSQVQASVGKGRPKLLQVEPSPHVPCVPRHVTAAAGQGGVFYGGQLLGRGAVLQHVAHITRLQPTKVT